jgi:hypothetical protein
MSIDAAPAHRLTGDAQTLPGAMQFVLCSGDSNESQ